MKNVRKIIICLVLLYNTLYCFSQSCKPSFQFSGSTYGLYTAKVELDSISNSSTMPSSSPYYTYYANQSTTVKTGYGYWLKLTAGPSSFGYNNIAAWIDFNGNDTFETSEKLGELNDIASSATDSIYFSVPANADTVQVKMRVIFSYYYQNITPCGSYYYGDCEDYPINIKYVPCTSPPTPGSVVSSHSYVCTSTKFTLSLQGTSLGANQSFQWQKSTDNTNWNNIGGALKMSLTTSQSDSTYYRCLVTCSGYTDSTQSILIAQKPGTACYCNARSYYGTIANIANVSFGKFSNGTDTLPVESNPTCNSGYADYTGIGYIPLIRGNTYPFSVTQISGSYFYSCDVNAWIDYNQNGEFESGELIYTGSTSLGLYGNTVRKNIKIPANVKTGVTGMRVKISYISSSSGVCDTAYYGEAEDYFVYVYDQKTIDAYIYNIDNPLAKSCYSSAEPVKVSIYNSGSDTLKFANNNMTVHVDMTNANSGSLDSVISSGQLAPNASMIVTFKGKLNMAQNGGTNDITASVSISDDSIAFNDKLKRSYTPANPVKTPYIVDFENYAAVPKSYVGNGFTWSYTTGLNATSSLRASMMSSKRGTSSSELIGPLTKNSALKFNFRPTGTMPKTDTVFIKISTDCGVSYQTIYKILSTNSSAYNYSSFQYDLGKYAGNNIILKIITSPNSATNYNIDFDDIAIADKPQINLGRDTVVCDKIVLNANPGHYYNWLLSWSKFKLTDDTLLVKQTGNYWCTATDSIYGISNTDTIRVDVYPTPQANLGPDFIVCSGNTAVLSPGKFTGPYKYKWSTGDTTSTITISKAGIYMVEVINPAGCSDMDTIYIASANKPTGSAVSKGTPFDGKYNAGTSANPDGACAGNLLTYEVSAPNGYNNSQYGNNWFLSAEVQTLSGTAPVGKYSLTTPTSNSNGYISFSPDVADADSTFIISLSVLDANTTCDMSLVRYIKVNPAPVVNLGSDQDVCPGVLVYWSTGGNYASYLWSTGSTAPMIAVSAPGNYWLKVTDNNGCSNYDTGAVNNYTPPTVNLGFDRGTCAGRSFMLDAGNAAGYLWSTGSNSQSIKVTQSGSYWAMVYSNDGCTATDTVNIDILPKLSGGFTVKRNSANNILFLPDSTFYQSYAWDFGDSSISTKESPTHIYSNDGVYNVKLVVVGKYGCTDSATIPVTINTGINTLDAKVNQLLVFPNPYKNSTQLSFNLVKSSNVNIELYDMYGKKINTITNGRMMEGKQQFIISTQNIAQAFYIIKLSIDGQSTFIRLLDLGNE